MQIRVIRPWCGYYTRVKTPLGEKYWRECCTLSLPYQINSLPGHFRLLMCKGNVTNIVKTNWRANTVENTT